MDRGEFTARAEALIHRMFRISYLILKRDADCQDAMQEALLRAWRHIDSLKEPAYFESWLIRILINESKRLLAARPHTVSIDEARIIHADEPPDPALRDAIRAMDARYRIPIVLNGLEGYTAKQVAEMLKLPVSTVKWRIHHGKQLLARMLSDERGEEQ